MESEEEDIVNIRERLHQEIEATRAAYHRLLDSLPEATLSLPSDNQAWNIRLWDPLLAGNVTVEYLFGYFKRHFDSHAAQVEKVIHSSTLNEQGGAKQNVRKGCYFDK